MIRYVQYLLEKKLENSNSNTLPVHIDHFYFHSSQGQFAPQLLVLHTGFQEIVKG